MAKLPMLKMTILGLRRERKAVLETLQRMETVEVSDLVRAEDEEKLLEVFRHKDVAYAVNTFDEHIRDSIEAREILASYTKKYHKAPSLFDGRDTKTEEEYAAFEKKYPVVLRYTQDILRRHRRILELESKIREEEARSEAYEPWLSLNAPLENRETQMTFSTPVSLPIEKAGDDLERILKSYAEEGDLPLSVTDLGTDNGRKFFYIVAMKRDRSLVEEALRRLGGSPPVHTSSLLPREAKERSIQRREASLKEIEEDKKRIMQYEEKIDDIIFLEDYERLRLEKYQVLHTMLVAKKSFLLTGYIPANKKDEVSAYLTRHFTVALDFSEPSPEEEVPVKLKNPLLSAPLESAIQGYGLPGKKDLDPTFAVSLFYYFFFGLMLSDAGYGFVMALACIILLIWKKDRLEEAGRKTLTMYLLCGLATIFWGVLFGSYFGDLYDIIMKTFFHKQVRVPALWFFPVEKPMKMLVFAMALGLIHIFAGLFMKVRMCIRDRDFKGLLYDCFFWYILLISGIIILLSLPMMQDMFNLHFAFPKVFLEICKYAAYVCMIGIVLTNGRESRNPVKRLLKGLYALYGISGYLSDVLSYSRLLALGLATGVIASVVNTIAAMAAGGGGLLGVIPFVLVLVFGHSVNMGINALGAYVHTNRLQYVEFFGKFYDGSGKAFRPFRMSTQYYKFKETKENG